MAHQLLDCVFGILSGDTEGDVISKMKWSNGVLTLDQHSREYDGFVTVRRGQSLRPTDVVAAQAFGRVADEMLAAGFAVVDDIRSIESSVKL